MFFRATFALVLLLQAVSLTVGIAQERRGRWDPAQFLQRLDRNGDGRLEPDEMVGRAKGFIDGLGMDTSGSVSISDVLSAIDRQREDAEAEEAKKESERAASADWATPRLVPGFGEESKMASVPKFGEASGDDDSASEQNDTPPSESVVSQVDRVLNQYDRNKDKVLDAEEIQNTPWGEPSPQESDTNGDGRLTREELVARYRKREADSARLNGDGDRRSSRGDTDERRSGDERSDDRRSDDRRSSGGSTSSNSSPAAAASEDRSSSRGSSQQDRVADYVQQLLREYDSNNDGSLSADEQSKMRSSPKNADADSDGQLSRDELTTYYGGGYRQSSPAGQEAPATEPSANHDENGSNKDADDSSRSERRREARRDREPSNRSRVSGDQPVKMHEFTDEWTAEKLAEFRELDLNHDGVISVEEFRQRK